jgi:AcrR family transcriptional regulator
MEQIVWTRAGGQSRGPQPSLTLEQIAAAAVGIADREGLDAVSMRRVAAELGCGTMSLYRYVRTKDELHDLMRDAVAGERPDPPAGLPGDWRTGLRVVAQAMRANALRHPWLPALIVGRAAFGPNEMAGTEAILAMLAGYGLTADETMGVFGVLGSFVQGFVERELSERTWRRPAETDAEREWQVAMGRYLGSLAESGRYPHFTRLRDAATKAFDPDRAFAWQLDRVLDGLATVLDRPVV